jgi:DNA-binding NarL/FixJ family response regulator
MSIGTQGVDDALWNRASEHPRPYSFEVELGLWSCPEYKYMTLVRGKPGPTSNTPNRSEKGGLALVEILVVDDQGLMLEGLRTILELEEDFRVAGTAKTPEEALQRCETLAPQVVVMDVPASCMAQVDAIKIMKERHVGIVVIALSSHSTDQCVLGTLSAGADAFLLKDSPSEDLIRAVRVGLTGGVSLSPLVARRVVEYVRCLSETGALPTEAESPLESPLTERETDVLRLVAEGLTNREIGEALYITEGTVKNHVSSVCRKLGARDRTQIAVWAWKHAIMRKGCQA